MRIAIMLWVLATAAYAQTKMEFDVASIRVNPPRTGFHLTTDANSGVADFSNPGTFRCSGCTMVTLIRKAFDLQNYQLPGRSSLGTNTFDVMAKIPAGATQENIRTMMQNLLKERFGLAFHYEEKPMRGYHLVIAKNGSKLKESTGEANRQRSDHGQGQGQGQDHTHAGLMVFGGSAAFRGDHKTTAELAQILSDHLGQPVDDQTKVAGKYDISLRWSGSVTQSGGNHPEGTWGGGAGHGGHSGGGAGAYTRRDDQSAPTLFDALQSQLGLRLVASERAMARVFVIDHVEQAPTAN